MKNNKSKGYLLTKGFISFFMLFSAYYSFSHAEDLRLLGFPDYFRVELVTAKVVGSLILLLPQTPLRVKEWIYSGFLIAMISALIAHICSGDPVSKIIFVSVDLILVVLSIQFVSRRDYANKEGANDIRLQ